jgi:hypothetical protein
MPVTHHQYPSDDVYEIEIPEELADTLHNMAAATLSDEVRYLLPQSEWVRATATILLRRAAAEYTATAQPQEERRGRGPAKAHLLAPHKDRVVSDLINHLSETKNATIGVISGWVLDTICAGSNNNTCPVDTDYLDKWTQNLMVELRAAKIVQMHGTRAGAYYTLADVIPAANTTAEIPF